MDVNEHERLPNITLRHKMIIVNLVILRLVYNQNYWCFGFFFYFSLRELDGLKVWDGFGLFSFTFKIADSEPSVLREALKSILFFLTILMCHMARTANKVHIMVFLQYPTFNWVSVSFTHVHRGFIYRESYTLISWYLILCNNIVIFFQRYLPIH